MVTQVKAVIFIFQLPHFICLTLLLSLDLQAEILIMTYIMMSAGDPGQISEYDLSGCENHYFEIGAICEN